MTTAYLTDRPAWKLALCAAFAAVFAFLVHRNLGLHAHIFADEWYYSKMSRLMALGEAIVPSYLYLWVFGGSNACGTAFYDCVKVANVLFVMGAAPFVYLVARELAGKAQAAALALLATLAPLSIYTAHFMPESMYYFGFWLFAWVALTRLHWHWAAHALAAGAALGLMSLVKVHALFLAPALCLFLLYAHWTRGGAWARRALAAMALAAAGVAGVKFALGYALAGAPALDVFGSFYASTATSASGRPLLALLDPAFVNARGHLLVLAIVLPLPLALLAQWVLRPPARAAAGQLALLHLFALLMLGSALGMAVLYTASIATPGEPLDEGLRLHLRYYSFVFPLLWIAAAATIARPDDGQQPALRWIIALLLGTLIAIALVKLPTYTIMAVDGPEADAVNPVSLRGKVIIALGLAALLLWALRSRLAAPLYLYALLPALLASAAVMAERHVAGLRHDRPADRAGAAVRQHVPPAERGDLTVAGHAVQELMQAQFVIDHKDTELMHLPWGQPIEHYQLPARDKWLLVLGRHALPEGARVKPVLRTAEFTLARINAGLRLVGTVVLSQPFGNGLVASAEGLSGAEPWGRWSDAKRVVLHFKDPLPRRLNVILKPPRAFGPNARLPFVVRAGDQSASFRLDWPPRDIGLYFETDGNARSLVIEVPQPVSPVELGQGSDPRKLGIGLSEIDIVAYDEPAGP